MVWSKFLILTKYLSKKYLSYGNPDSNLHLNIVPILLINGPNLMKFGNKGLCYFPSILMGTRSQAIVELDD